MLCAGPRSGPPAWRNRTPKSREGRGRSAAPESGPKGSPVWATDGSKERWGAEGSSPAAEAWGGAGRHSCTSFPLDQTQPSSKKHLPPRAPGTSSQTPGSSVHISYSIKKPFFCSQRRFEVKQVVQYQNSHCKHFLTPPHPFALHPSLGESQFLVGVPPPAPDTHPTLRAMGLLCLLWGHLLSEEPACFRKSRVPFLAANLNLAECGFINTSPAS